MNMNINVNPAMTNMASSKRENEEIMNKLDRILGFCSNTKENIDSMILKFSMNSTNDPEIYNENHLKEDMKVVSTNIDSIMNFVDPIFKHYLVLPNTTENENLPIFLNTRKSDDLIKYENSLINIGGEKTNIDGFYRGYQTSAIENTSSPQNLNQFSINKESESYNSKIKENMNNISRVLSERIKKNVKDNLARASYSYKPENQRNTSELVTLFENTKKMLNKK